MKCSRKNCNCVVDPSRAVEIDGRTYCGETCAKECTDDRCVCRPCDCEKV